MASRTVNIKQLELVENDELGSWRGFKKRFDIAIININFRDKVAAHANEGAVQAADDQESYRKGAALLNVIGEEGMAIFETFDISVGDIRYEDLVERFEGYFAARENRIIRRHRFLSMEQKAGENMCAFVRRVRVASRSCQFGDFAEDMCVQVAIMGMSNMKLRNELLVTKDLSLTKTMEISSRFDSAERTEGVLQRTNRPVVEVDRVDRRVRQKGVSDRCFGCGGYGHWAADCSHSTARQRTAERAQVVSQGTVGAVTAVKMVGAVETDGTKSGRRDGCCFRCGEEGHFQRECDRGQKQGRRCFKCGRQGHIAIMCTANKARGVSQGTVGMVRAVKTVGAVETANESRQREGDKSGALMVLRREGRCFRCEEEGHFQRDCARGRNKTRCFRFDQQGHIAAMCTERRVQRASQEAGGREELVGRAERVGAGVREAVRTRGSEWEQMLVGDDEPL